VSVVGWHTIEWATLLVKILSVQGTTLVYPALKNVSHTTKNAIYSTCCYIFCVVNVLYSADHTGVFCKWACPASHDAILSWRLDRSISLAELKNHVITNLELQPTNHNRLLICTQNGRVFLIDTNVYVWFSSLPIFNMCVSFVRLHIVRHYHDNNSVQTNQSVAVFSACGTYVLLGVGHHLKVCHANNGVVVGQYHALPLHHPLTCLLFHPMDHIIALSAFGTNEPVLVYSYNKEGELCYVLPLY